MDDTSDDEDCKFLFKTIRKHNWDLNLFKKITINQYEFKKSIINIQKSSSTKIITYEIIIIAQRKRFLLTERNGFSITR